MQIIFLRNEKSFYTCKYIGSVQDLLLYFMFLEQRKVQKG